MSRLCLIMKRIKAIRFLKVYVLAPCEEDISHSNEIQMRMLVKILLQLIMKEGIGNESTQASTSSSRFQDKGLILNLSTDIHCRKSCKDPIYDTCSDVYSEYDCIH